MKDARRYQRYTFDKEGKTIPGVKILLEGEEVRLVDFSVGDLSVIAKKPYPLGGVSFSVILGDHGAIDLVGNVVRVKEEGSMWRIAIDLTEIYNLSMLRKA